MTCIGGCQLILNDMILYELFENTFYEINSDSLFFKIVKYVNRKIRPSY